MSWNDRWDTSLALWWDPNQLNRSVTVRRRDRWIVRWRSLTSVTDTYTIQNAWACLPCPAVITRGRTLKTSAWWNVFTENCPKSRVPRTSWLRTINNSLLCIKSRPVIWWSAMDLGLAADTMKCWGRVTTKMLSACNPSIYSIIFILDVWKSTQINSKTWQKWAQWSAKSGI